MIVVANSAFTELTMDILALSTTKYLSKICSTGFLESTQLETLGVSSKIHNAGMGFTWLLFLSVERS